MDLDKPVVLVMTILVTRDTPSRIKAILRFASTNMYFIAPIPFARSAIMKHIAMIPIATDIEDISLVLTVADGAMTPLVVSAMSIVKIIVDKNSWAKNRKMACVKREGCSKYSQFT